MSEEMRLTMERIEEIRPADSWMSFWRTPVITIELRQLCDLALSALSQAAVRDEAFSVHHDFDLERITLAMVQAVDDEYACNEKLRIAYAHDAEYRRRTIAAVHQRLLKGWIDLVIKPLLEKYHRHFQSMQRIVERETLKREPNAAAKIGQSYEVMGIEQTAAPAAPDVVCCCASHHPNYGRCLQCPIHGTLPPGASDD